MCKLGDRVHYVPTDLSKLAKTCVKRFHLVTMLCPFRYSWTANMSTVIIRHEHHEKCANNTVGFLVFPHERTDTFDAFCYDDKGDYVHRK